MSIKYLAPPGTWYKPEPAPGRAHILDPPQSLDQAKPAGRQDESTGSDRDRHPHPRRGVVLEPVRCLWRRIRPSADKYFRSSRRPTISVSVAAYRERRIGLVMFTVDAETQMGRRRIP